MRHSNHLEIAVANGKELESSDYGEALVTLPYPLKSGATMGMVNSYILSQQAQEPRILHNANTITCL